MFDSLVWLILHSGVELFGYNEAKRIALIHWTFPRKILCVMNSTNLDDWYGELRRCTLKWKEWKKNKWQEMEINVLKKGFTMCWKKDADNNSHTMTETGSKYFKLDSHVKFIV